MYIVYITTNLINNKKYIGVHKLHPKKYSYLGSGKILWKAIKKYGRKNFKRETLFTYEKRLDAYKKEEELVTQTVVASPEYYNQKLGGAGGNPGEGNYMYGKTHDSKIRKKIANRPYSSGKDHARSRSIVCFETGEIFHTTSDVNNNGRKLDLGRALARGLSAGGYHWQYLDTFDANMVYGDIPKIKRRVLCIELDLEFETLSAASLFCGGHIQGTSIGLACRNSKRTAYGYRWRFLS